LATSRLRITSHAPRVGGPAPCEFLFRHTRSCNFKASSNRRCRYRFAKEQALSGKSLRVHSSAHKRRPRSLPDAYLCKQPASPLMQRRARFVEVLLVLLTDLQIRQFDLQVEGLLLRNFLCDLQNVSMIAGASLRQLNPQPLAILGPWEWLVYDKHPDLLDPSEPQGLAFWK
jgi:hypothetical protein